MRREHISGLALGFTMLMALAACAAPQTAASSLCDNIAGHIKANAALQSGADGTALLAKLSEGDHPFITVARADKSVPTSTEKDEFIKQFRAQFNPSAGLDQAMNNFLELGHAELWSVPESDFYMAVNFGGTASCQSFVLFRAPQGREAQELPELPSKGERDGDNAICAGYGSTGYLARIDGKDAFLESYAARVKNDYSLRVVPLVDGRWSTPCVLEASYQNLYIVDKTYASEGGPVSKSALQSIAASIVERWNNKGDSESVTFGPPVPEVDRENFETMKRLADARVTFPAFGAEKELTPYEQETESPDTYPLVLDGQTYLLRIGRGNIGWREYPNTLVVLYTLKDGALQPAASAIVMPKQGSLASLNVKPG